MCWGGCQVNRAVLFAGRPQAAVDIGQAWRHRVGETGMILLNVVSSGSHWGGADAVNPSLQL